jgi:23S rRNA (cytidine1920-2'-O)/16S rRNA (cytidine1409-2'-O)-methyltransferase
LRSDARVVCIEGVNARSLTADDLLEHHRRALMLALDAAEAAGTLQDQPELLAALDADFEPVFDFLTGDLSFISLTLVLPAVVRLLKPGGDLLMLVKPQFELQPGQIGKGGIVRDAVHFEFVEKRLRDCCAELGLEVSAWLDSPIEGGDGNREFFIQARKGLNAQGEDKPLPAAPARQAAKRVPRSATRSLLDAMDEDGEAAHAGQPGPARSKKREKKNAA